MSLLQDILDKLNTLPESERKKLIEDTVAATNHLPWIPSPGPQTEAYRCKADILLYGGQGGGGKSSLLLGLALTAHNRSLIMRRQYGDLGALTEELLRFYGTRDGFNASPPPKLRTKDGRLIEFGAAALLGSEEAWQGQAHDLLGFDEAVHFAEQQIRFLMGWNRSPLEGQRSRTVLATNPPVTTEGQWIIGMFRPWLDITYENPAKHGELRWFMTYPDGSEKEVPDGTPMEFTVDGVKKIYTPKTRTFIHASLEDNPFLLNTGYQATLDAMPEPYRSAIRDGNFMAARKDEVNQLIPTDWIRKAQQRWTENPPKGIPMSAMGVDVAQGGIDNTVIQIRHDGWFAKALKYPGKDTPGGHEVAGLVVTHRRDNCPVVIDMGGGYGGAAMEHLRDNRVDVVPYKGATKTSKKSKKEQYGFHLTRDYAYWMLREALDPNQPNGSYIALPDSPTLMADLTTLRFEIDGRGVYITPKEKVREILGRSPDEGDAVAMAWYAGPKGLGTPEDWAKHLSYGTRSKQQPVIMKTRGSRR